MKVFLLKIVSSHTQLQTHSQNFLSFHNNRGLALIQQHTVTLVVRDTHTSKWEVCLYLRKLTKPARSSK